MADEAGNDDVDGLLRLVRGLLDMDLTVHEVAVGAARCSVTARAAEDGDAEPVPRRANSYYDRARQARELAMRNGRD